MYTGKEAQCMYTCIHVYTCFIHTVCAWVYVFVFCVCFDAIIIGESTNTLNSLWP